MYASRRLSAVPETAGTAPDIFDYGISLPSFMDKNGLLLFTDLFQKPANFLKILCTCGFSQMKTLYVLLIQKRNSFLYLLEYCCFSFSYRLFPDKSIFVCTGFRYLPDVDPVYTQTIEVYELHWLRA